jgi:hypothetical protein
MMGKLYSDAALIVYDLKDKISEALASLNKTEGNLKLVGYTPSDMLVFEVIEPHFKEIGKKERKINDIAKKYDLSVQDKMGTKMLPLKRTIGLVNPEYEEQKMLISKLDGIVAVLSPNFVEITSDVSLGEKLMEDLKVLYS